jgi:anti-sigma B factor antagonist
VHGCASRGATDADAEPVRLDVVCLGSGSESTGEPIRRRTTILSDTHTSKPDEAGAVEFAITCHELDERTNVIAIEGDLDLSTAPRLKWMLLDSLQEGRNRVVLDLSRTTFMDSTALGVLVVVNRRLEEDARLAVVCDRPAVLRIFELSGMDGAFAIFPGLDEALAHVHSPTAGAA